MRMTVEDVMTADVVAVDAQTAFHAVAELLIKHAVSGVPVLDDRDRVLGVVSEADLLRKEEFKQRYYGDYYRPPLRARLRHRLGNEGGTAHKADGETAGELMTSPAIVTTPDSPIVLAARMMDRHGVKRLPVVTSDGTLVGIVSRRDLIRAFIRGDKEIERRIRDDVVVGTLQADPGSVEVTVDEGVVTLSGQLGKHSEAIAAVRMAENVDGVVAVIDQLSWRKDDIVSIPIWGGA